MPEQHKVEKTLTGLLRKSIVPASDARQESCPDPDLLAAYYDRSLNDSETTRVEQHFANCAQCQQYLAVMVRAEPPQDKTKARVWNWRLVSLWVTPLAVAAAVFVILIARPSLKTAKEKPAATEVAQFQDAPLKDSKSLPLNGRSTDQLLQLAPGASAPQKKLDRTSVPLLSKNEAREKEPTAKPKSAFSNSASVGGESESTRGTAGGAMFAKRRDEEKQHTSGAPSASAQQATSMATLESSAAPAAPVARGASSAPVPAPAPPPPMTAPQPPPPAAIAAMTNGNNLKSADSTNAPVARESEAQKTARQGVFAGRLPQSTSQAPTVEGSRASADSRAIQLIVYSPDLKVMWRISGQGRIEISKDAGRNWQEQFVDAKRVFTAAQAPSTSICWVVGHAGLVMLTTDGAKWKTLSAPTSMDLVNVMAKDAKHADVTVSDGSMYSTKDGGKTWQPK